MRGIILFTVFAAMAVCSSPGSAQEGGLAPSRVATIAATCSLCHGPNGSGSPGVESLIGFSRAEFIEEMHELPEEPSEYRLMSVLARGYDRAQIEALATYFVQARGTAEDPYNGSEHDDDEEEGKDND
ncbi:MAG: hypothetical protein RIC85_05715 [Gammaproteobacteria bacterium]